MRPTVYSTDDIEKLLRKQKIATMAELMEALGTRGRRTVFRKLKQLRYRTSYSHRGRYYTLDDIAEFDERGLWAHGEVRYSIHGTLLATAAAMVAAAEVGHFVEELDNRLHVGTRDALLELVRGGRLKREKGGGRHLYCSADAARARLQVLGRRASLAEPGVSGPLPDATIMPD